MENTIVGVYDSYAQAESAMNDLLAAGFARDAVRLSAQTAGGGSTAGEQKGESRIGHFFRSLFGLEEHREQRDIYAEAVRRGSCVLAVDADSDDSRDRAVEIMNRHDPVDIDERAAHWRSQGWSGYDESAPLLTDAEIERERGTYAQSRAAGTAQTAGTGEAARIPVVEEELRVGKREVQRGGVRVYQRVSEKPVQESVQLREEHVDVERHAVDQPATEADLAAFKEGSVEVREMAEEPVVSKSARVVEEVVVSKEATQRTEQVNDTVRRTDVEVEQLGADSGRRTDYADTAASADDADYRRHWQSAYGSTGGRYEDYDAAYRYGSTMAGSGRFQNYQWQDVEPQLRSDWETHHPESTWDKVKDAVRYGAERVTGRHH
ncbi:MAG: YsnF/AvaK domain-containing protein [Bacillota bacterium]